MAGWSEVRGLTREVMYASLWLICIVLQHKPREHCKVILLLKNKLKKKKTAIHKIIHAKKKKSCCLVPNGSHMAFNTNYFISSAQKTSSCFLGDSEGKASACNAGDLGSIPGSGRPVEKEIATHSSTLAWRIPWMEEPGKLESMGSQRVRHD